MRIYNLSKLPQGVDGRIVNSNKLKGLLRHQKIPQQWGGYCFSLETKRKRSPNSSKSKKSVFAKLSPSSSSNWAKLSFNFVFTPTTPTLRAKSRPHAKFHKKCKYFRKKFQLALMGVHAPAGSAHTQPSAPH